MMYRSKTRQKNGIPPELSQEIGYQIKEELKESSYHGQTTKQIEELISNWYKI